MRGGWNLRGIEGPIRGLLRAGVLGVMLVAGQACTTAPSASTAPAVTAPAVTAQADDAVLFEAFGGKAGLTSIANDLVATMTADPRIRDYFENVSHKRLSQLLFEQFCVVTGGPCEYTGRTMQRSHAGLNIDRAAFNALVEDLQDTMDRHHVPFRAQNRLLAKLAPMYRDVEER